MVPRVDSYLSCSYHCNQPEIIYHIVRPRSKNVENHLMGKYKDEERFYKHLRRQARKHTGGLDSRDWWRFLLSSKSLAISLSFSSIILSARSRNESCSSYRVMHPIKTRTKNITIPTTNPSPRTTRYEVPLIFYNVVWAPLILFAGPPQKMLRFEPS